MTHILLDGWWEGGEDKFSTEIQSRQLLDNLCEKHKLNVLERVFHWFEPQGMTCVYVLSESHLSVHTWPELGFVSIDLFCCRNMDDSTITDIINYFQEELELVIARPKTVRRSSERPCKTTKVGIRIGNQGTVFHGTMLA